MSSEDPTSPALLRSIYGSAPVRILDNGGWTDTWFAVHGRVFNIAGSPCAQMRIDAFASDGTSEVTLDAKNYDDVYSFIPGGGGKRGKHQLLEAAVEDIGVPSGMSLRISAYCEVPAGASTGTSAAVLVALVAALKALHGEEWTPEGVAYAAHHIEMDVLKHQCGIQDHIASAYGGINYIQITKFPRADVQRLSPPRPFLAELERRLVLIYLGKSHDSADMHARVIRKLENAGPGSKFLEHLRVAADHARDASMAGDIRSLGGAMIENTDAQQRLHPDLVSSDAMRVIEIARANGAIGWKVNGAGGEGGTITILSAESPAERAAMIAAITSADRTFREIPVRLSPSGVRTWE